jgi:dihydropteroate synthase
MPAPTAIGPHSFVWGQRTFIMGIINVTPDSFSGDGVGGDVQAAVRQARRFVAAGADILDIGGESTRPGARPVSARTEIRRVVPAIRAIAQALPRTPISVDTWKAEVAQAALAAGAHLVNDVWGLQRDPAMAAVVAQAGCPVVVMHNRTAPPARDEVGGHYRDVAYEDLMADIIAGLRASIARARAAGIPEERIIVDPGLGFGKTAEQNLEVMRRLREVRSLGRPVLVGPSRKSTIGRVLGLPPEKRQEGTAALVTLAIAGGADIVRVHDVRQMVRVVRMTDAVVYGWREQEEAHG